MITFFWHCQQWCHHRLHQIYFWPFDPKYCSPATLWLCVRVNIFVFSGFRVQSGWFEKKNWNVHCESHHSIYNLKSIYRLKCTSEITSMTVAKECRNYGSISSTRCCHCVVAPDGATIHAAICLNSSYWSLISLLVFYAKFRYVSLI